MKNFFSQTFFYICYAIAWFGVALYAVFNAATGVWVPFYAAGTTGCGAVCVKDYIAYCKAMIASLSER